jgi:hypothetical protein
MPEYPNPIFPAVVGRTVGPFIPVWLFGVVVGLLLDSSGLNGSLGHAQVLEFLGFYSLLVGALVAALLIRQYQSSPVAVDVDVDGLVGWVYRRGGENSHGRRKLLFPFGGISTVSGGGILGCRVEGRRADGNSSDWLNLTKENAERLSVAWQAWKQREAPGDE